MAFTKLLFVVAALGLVSGRPDGVKDPSDNNVDIEQVPFVASVHIGAGQYKGSFICGAVIIHEKYVLTVASCLDASTNNPDNEFEVVVGTASYADSDGTVYEIDEVIIHENYNNNEADEYNIALLRLAKPITFTESVATVNIPKDELPLTEDTLLTITGWFYDINKAHENNTNEGLRFLQEQVSFFDESTCRSICAPVDVHTSKHNVCAGFYCQDSAASHGTALTYDNKLVGVKSVFYGCNKAAAVYIKVSSFKCWIDNIIVNDQ